MASNILLLQGPMGPFFKRFARDLEAAGNTVYKINFNAGDRFYYHDENSVDYTDSLERWPEFIKQHLVDWKIDTIYLFGNERRYHRMAQKTAHSFYINVFVFEEGYLRPHYITLEKDGVNGRSSMPRAPEAYKDVEIKKAKKDTSVPYAFMHAAWYAIVYFIVGWLGRGKFPHYVHHRRFNPYIEAGIWLRAAFRKYYYQIRELGILRKLTTHSSKEFFIVPLQVHNDAQIKTWSPVPSAAAFIRRIISSFAKYAPADTLLVIKHHPLDRGYSDYTRIIKNLASKYDCNERIIYVHDLHLPTLLFHAKGTILLNSTVGLSSILHGTPVKTLGHAVYNIKGLTFQGEINSFWKNPGKVDRKLNQQFRNYLIDKNQVNGNFYRKIPVFNSHSGIDFKRLCELTQTAVDTTNPSKVYATQSWLSPETESDPSQSSGQTVSVMQ